MTQKAKVQKTRQETLHISLLGNFSLHIGETAVLLETPRYQSLLAFLVLHPQQPHTRQQLAFQFWPDSNESQARTNLRKAIHTIRQTLPHAEDFISIDRQSVQWWQEEKCQVDVWQFETAVTQAEKASSPLASQPCLDKAIQIYGGDFLPGHYDDWVLASREKLRQQYLTVLENLLMLHENQRHYPEAIQLAQTLLREDPLHEAAYRRLMRLQSLDGNTAGALRTYHTCSTKLQRELGVSPSQTTQETYERLLKLKTPRHAAKPARVSLIAREQIWTQLQSVWQCACHEKSQVVLLTGEAGIGKTRMAEELIDWAQRQGIMALTAVCYPSEGQLPYAPIADWLRSDAFQDVFSAVPDKWLIECARLLPEMVTRRNNLAAPEPLREAWQQQHFFSALAQTILTAHQPLLLFVDDLHWCDPNTLDWLHFLLRFDKQSRLLLMGTIRTEEVAPNHLLIAWQQFLQRDNILTNLPLPRLNIKETNQLAQQFSHQPFDEKQSERLYFETEGVPLFIVEMVNAGFPNLQEGNGSGASNLPSKVLVAIETRLSQLSSKSRRLANVAAAIGRSFTFDLLAAASGDDEEVVVCGLDELWQRRIVREKGRNAYDFSHDKLRQVAYASLSSARRIILHKGVIHAYEALFADNLDAVGGQLAVHYEASQQPKKAVYHYQRAASVSNRVFAHQETIQNLNSAIALLPKTIVSPQQQVEIYELLGDVLALTGMPAKAREVFETAVSHALEPIKQSQLFRKIANTFQVRVAYDEAFLAFQQAETVLGETKETISKATEAWWQEWLWIQLDKLWVLYLVNRDEDMAQLAEQILPVLNECGLSIQRGFYHQRLMVLGFRRERYVLSQETIQHAQASLNTIEQDGQVSQIAFARFALGMAHLWFGWFGNLDEAEACMQTALKEAEDIEDVILQSRLLTYLSLIYRRRREIEKARSYISRGLTVSENAKMPLYIGQTEGNAAWLAWFEGDLKKAKELGQSAVAKFQVSKTVMPFWGMALWPLIGVAVEQQDSETAVTYAHMLLDPAQSQMSDEITAVLQQAIIAWENDCPNTAQTKLSQAVQLAQKYNYL